MIAVELVRAAHDPENFRVQYQKARHYVDHLPACDVAPADPPNTRYTSVTTLTKRAWPSVFKKNAVLPDGSTFLADIDLVRAWNHLVNVAGIDVTSVVDAVAFLGAASADLEAAAQRGMDVHAVFEAVVTGAPVPPLVFEYLDAIMGALAALGPMANALTERACFNRALGYAGAFDCAFIVPDDGVWKLIDFKSRGPGSKLEPQPGEIAQVGGYSMAEYLIDSRDGVAFRVPMPRIDALELVLVRPDAWAIVPLEVERSQAAWLDLLECDKVRARGQSLARSARRPFSVGVAGARPDDGTPTEPTPRAATLARLRNLTDDQRELVKLRWRWDVPAKDLPDAELPALVALIDDVARDTGAPFTDTESPQVTPQPQPVVEVKAPPVAFVLPPDGGPLDDDTIDALRAHVRAAPAAVQAWMQTRTKEARIADRPISGNTVRWFEQARALLAAGTVVTGTWGGDDELLRCVLCAAMGDETAMQPAFMLGAIFGSLTIDQARNVTLACEARIGQPDRAPVGFDAATGAATLAA